MSGVLERKPILIIRHGEAISNKDPQLGPWMNTGLSELGTKQVEALALRLSNEYTNTPVSIVSSDLNRAYESAEILGEWLGVKPVVNKGIRQFNFGFGSEVSVEESERMKRKTTGRIIDWRPYSTSESVRELYNRVGNTMTELVENQKDFLIVVSHSYIIDKILNWWIGYPEEELKSLIFYTANASISRLGYYREDEHGLLCVNGTTHLRGSLVSENMD